MSWDKTKLIWANDPRIDEEVAREMAMVETLSYNELRSHAKSRGINSRGMKQDRLIKEVEKRARQIAEEAHRRGNL